MEVKIQTITPDIEENIVEIARVSSSRKNKTENPEGLLNYLIKHKHWSPFEHGSITFSIKTSKAIGIQLIRHRSFTFQEFSQRYSKVTEIEPIELRKQAENNRQSSTEVFNPVFKDWELDLSGGRHDGESYDWEASNVIDEFMNNAVTIYNTLLEHGVARECARMILPMATSTHIYMTGTLRSWIHFIEIRNSEHAQKEIKDIAQSIQEIIKEQCPIVANALGW